MRGDSIRVMHPLFQTDQGGSIPTSPLQMRVDVIDRAVASQLNAAWHSRLPKFPTKQPITVCFGAHYDDRIYAVAIWSRPVARMLPHKEWLELRRLAIAPDAPKNTASWLLAIMRRIIRKRYPEITELISYQDVDVHTGTIYRAAGWERRAFRNASEWGQSPRYRPKGQVLAPKIRWQISVGTPSIMRSA